tara:strand:+ start:4380 stop:4688 length:309 start_codon:yes stop_codon:yes gene_type:complete
MPRELIRIVGGIALAGALVLVSNYEEIFGKELTRGDIDKKYNVCTVYNTNRTLSNYVDGMGIANNKHNKKLVKSIFLDENNVESLAELKERSKISVLCKKRK